jgi:hypothetical protein
MSSQTGLTALTDSHDGRVSKVTSEYQSSHAADDVMGIMLMYIDP